MNETKILILAKELNDIKTILGHKLAEFRQLAGFPKRTYPNSVKSPNLLFNIESGRNFPNKDTLMYFMEMYNINDKGQKVLMDLWVEGNRVKREIIRIKRGWN